MLSMITAAATRSVKPINQDACKASSTSIVVADGIGSFYRAEVAAQFATEYLSARLSSMNSTANADYFINAFKDIQQNLSETEEAKTMILPASHPASDVLGTTLLCAKAHDNWLTIAYVGNGAILHLRGEFTSFPANSVLPWNALNYLNPHSIAQEGRNVLVRFLSAKGSPDQSCPTVLQLQQDTVGAGDILILCTDGIHSNDQVRVGHDGEGSIWISGDQALQRLYKALGNFLLEAEPTSERLQYMLNQYLTDLETAQLIGDDCTVAVLVSGQTLKHFQQLRSTLLTPPPSYAAN